ncbi:acid ceramidase-like [Mya arenaria]|uniref:acid ceramidase-like n=1 Tax=Mya arenaria TaxID=6604 RepID=UPI0022E1B2F9|nr:acid ceramidase-like [Mya arenaria]
MDIPVVFTLSSLYILAILCCCSQGQSPPYEAECVEGKYLPPSSRRVKEYVVNLDLPGKERWKHVATEKKQEIKNILAAFKKYIYDFGGIAAEIWYLIDLLGPAIVDVLPQPFQDEIRGISDVTGIEIGEVTLYNIFYEIFTVCTSIVAQDSNGTLYHARNLDFGLFMGWDPKNRTWVITELLRPAIVNLDFQRGGKTVFKSVNYAGYVGILTAISPGKFTLTMNERFTLDGGYIGIIDLILTGKGTWMGFLTRATMEKAQSFEEAKTMLTSTQMIAPAYFILAGNTSGQACVITRNREVNGTDTWWMKEAGGWYILETNYDHWSKPLFVDDRRTPANKCMKKLTQKGVGIPGIFNVLSSRPVLNKLTTYTALMQVNQGHIETWLQYCPDPCFPW